jgi:hypothetical protein
VTLTGVAVAAGASADPFGLWAAPAPKAAAGDMVSFGLPGGGAEAGEEPPAAIWTLPLSSGPQGREASEEELNRRAGQVRAIAVGLNQADLRVDTLLAARVQQTNVVSFAVGSPTPSLAAPEAGLAYALGTLEPAGSAETVSFGLMQDIGRMTDQVKEHLPAAQIPGVDWNDLQQRLNGLMDSVNRQLLHFAWVDTTLDGGLVARTTVAWGGDIVTLWKPDLSLDQTDAHCRSLQLAMASRSANLRTVLTVSRIASKIITAVATPLGTLQALSLGWQFVQEVVMPLLDQSK